LDARTTLFDTVSRTQWTHYVFVPPERILKKFRDRTTRYQSTSVLTPQDPHHGSSSPDTTTLSLLRPPTTMSHHTTGSPDDPTIRQHQLSSLCHTTLHFDRRIPVHREVTVPLQSRFRSPGSPHSSLSLGVPVPRPTQCIRST